MHNDNNDDRALVQRRRHKYSPFLLKRKNINGLQGCCTEGRAATANPPGSYNMSLNVFDNTAFKSHAPTGGTVEERRRGDRAGGVGKRRLFGFSPSAVLVLSPVCIIRVYIYMYILFNNA